MSETKDMKDVIDAGAEKAEQSTDKVAEQGQRALWGSLAI
jgi:hypothetical protein